MPSLPSCRARVISESPTESQLGFAFAEECPVSEYGPDNRLNLESDDFDVNSIPSDCCIVALTNGGYTLVDEEDLCRVDEYNWFKCKRKYAWYAATWIKSGDDSEQIFMHRHLFGLTRGDRTEVDHENHDGLDNRRSTNLRLATRIQNTTNSRKLAGASSKYRGVWWDTRKGKWTSEISRYHGGVRKRFPLGFFDGETEAAYAFQVAAPLLKDPEFLNLEEIPSSELPDSKRLEEIRRNTISRVKLLLSGNKCILNKSSLYNGVTYVKRNNNWKATLTVGNKGNTYLGNYSTEVYAAYAYDCAVTILNLSDRRTNNVVAEDLGSLGMAAEIHAEVALRIESRRTGQKVCIGASSRYRGVSPTTCKTPWRVTFNNNTYIGLFKTEIDAAVAYNVAVSILGIPRLTPNIIPEESMPSAEMMEKIRLQVERRLSGTR